MLHDMCYNVLGKAETVSVKVLKLVLCRSSWQIEYNKLNMPRLRKSASLYLIVFMK